MIGRADVISSVPVPQSPASTTAATCRRNIVVAAAGQPRARRSIVELADAACGDGRAAPADGSTGARAPTAPRGCASTQKDTEQYHLCLGGPGSPRATSGASRCAILDTILGGSSSSRLFQEVREKRGLAYSVYSYASQYADTGQVGVYVGTRPDNVGEALEVIGTELRRLQRGRR